ncbi:MAG: hypothetical protein RL685_2437 [Pseudomonadota bacterium]
MNELQFSDGPAPLDGAPVASPAGDAGDDLAPATVIGSLQGTCDPLTGSGCGEGRTCRFDREAGAPVCRPAPAVARQPYAACLQDDECPTSFLCEAGVCSKLCASVSDCGWPSARCLDAAGGQLRRCSRSCDLASAVLPRAGLQACGEGTRCDFVSEVGAVGYSDCFAATGSSFDGAPCALHADCPADFRCEGQRCAAACAVGGACSGGLQCAGSVDELAGQRVGACCALPAGQQCDLLTSCGCGSGSTCSLGEAGAVACRVLPAQPKAPYASCNAHAECPARYSCIGGACKLHCQVTADCGAEGTLCVPATFGDVAIAGVSFCLRGCDVVSPREPAAGARACGEGATCVDATVELGATDCSNAGSGVQGASCQLEADCAPGFDCFLGACERWCASGGSECGLGLVCSGIYDVGGRELGSCCAPPLEQACDWVTDCGCGAGETCAAEASTVRSCRAVSAAPSEPYGSCATDAECPRFHHCFAGNCMQRCTSAAECATGTQCLVFDEADPDAGICSRNCDMLSPSAPAPGFQACGAGLRCLDFEGPEGATTVCLSAGSVGAGGLCGETSDCGLGLDCDDGLCLPLCEMSGSGCADGAVCSSRALATSPVGGRTIGVCRASEE